MRGAVSAIHQGVLCQQKLPQRMGALSDAAKTTIRHCDIKRFPVHQDIWLYLRVGLKELQTTLGPGSSFAFESDLSSLVQRVDMLFINARAVLHYICDPHGSPHHRLRAVVERLASIQDFKELLAHGSLSCQPLPARESEFHKLEFAKFLNELPTHLAKMDALQQVCAAGTSRSMIGSQLISVAR
jgi:hypothetical protein